MNWKKPIINLTVNNFLTFEVIFVWLCLFYKISLDLRIIFNSPNS